MFVRIKTFHYFQLLNSDVIDVLHSLLDETIIIMHSEQNFDMELIMKDFVIVIL